jgi:nucleotide-binding universal stress UspA family protein
VSQPPPTGEVRYRRILCAVDGSPRSNLVASHAIALAGALGAELVAVYAVPTDYHAGIHLKDGVREEVEAGTACVGAVVEQARAREVTVRSLLVRGDAGPAIVEAAESEQADLVVMGRLGMGLLERILMGSVSTYVVEHSPVAVLVAPTS